MEIRKYGKTDIKISALGYGAGLLGSDKLSDNNANELLEIAFENGINFFDTARSYENSELRLANFIKNKREKVIISTKVGYGVEGEIDWTYSCITKGVERALRELKTDYIDIVHLHSCGLDILKRGDVIQGLQKSKEEGKIRAIAYSGENESLFYAINTGCFDGFQASLNIFDQNIIDNFLPEIIKNNYGFIAKRPMANTPWIYLERPYNNYCEEYWLRMQELNFDIKNLDYSELAIRFSAFTYGVTACIAGTTNKNNLLNNINLVNKGRLNSEIYNYIRNHFQKTQNNWIGQI